MISYLKKMLKQNESVKLYMIDGATISVVHLKKTMSGMCLVIDEDNIEHLINTRYIVQIEA